MPTVPSFKINPEFNQIIDQFFYLNLESIEIETRFLPTGLPPPWWTLNSLKFTALHRNFPFRAHLTSHRCHEKAVKAAAGNLLGFSNRMDLIEPTNLSLWYKIFPCALVTCWMSQLDYFFESRRLFNTIKCVIHHSSLKWPMFSIYMANFWALLDWMETCSLEYSN